MKDRFKQLLTCALVGFASFVIVWPSHSIAAPDLAEFAKPQTPPPSPEFNPPSQAKFELGPLIPGEDGKRQTRRTPPLQDVGWNSLFGRDERFESLEGFFLGPIANENEMNQNLDHLPSELSNDPTYHQKFAAAFGKGPITLDKVTQSLGVYVRTLTSGISPFDRWVAGDADALSASA